MNGLCSLKGISSDATAFGLLARYLASLNYMVTMTFYGVEVWVVTNAPEQVVREYMGAHRG